MNETRITHESHKNRTREDAEAEWWDGVRIRWLGGDECGGIIAGEMILWKRDNRMGCESGS